MMTLLLPFLLDTWHASHPWCVDVRGDTILMACEAGVYYSPPMDIKQGVRLSADVKASAVGDGRFWCGMALNADIPADDRYAEVAIERGIAPYQGDTRAYGVQLSTPADRCCDRMLEAGDGWHHLSIWYVPGRADYTIDDARTSVTIDLGDTASAELLAVAVDPAEVKPGNVATCDWQNIEIEKLWSVALPMVAL